MWLVLIGCPPDQHLGNTDDQPGGDDDATGDDDDDTTPAPACSEIFNLEIVLLDIWGQDHPGAELYVHADGQQLAHVEDQLGPLLLPHEQAADFEIDVVDGGDSLPASVHLAWGGSSLPGDLEPDAPAGEGDPRAVHAFELRDEDDRVCPVVQVFLGLDHRWFAATGSPARGGNDVELLLNGEDAWAEVYEDLWNASDRIHHSTWYWTSDFELKRPGDHVHSSQAERAAYTALNVLDGQPATKRLLVNRFFDIWDWLDILYTDAELRQKAETPGDGFQVMLHSNTTEILVEGEYEGEPADFCFADRVRANPLYADAELLDPPCIGPARDLEIPAAAWHQKFWLIDEQVAYVTGMNTRTVDWDTPEHRVFEPKRMDFDASVSDREAVEAREDLPDNGPRRDFMIRVEGPCVQDVSSMFHERWSAAISGGAEYAENATPFMAEPYDGPADGEILAQVVHTVPEPWAEMSFSESLAKAFASAESYIFIENQYFRSPIINDALIETLLARPWVKLIVITWPIEPYEGGGKYTYLSDQLFRDLVPDQYLLLQARSFDVVLEEGYIWDTRDLYSEQIDVHSKLAIVDDRFLSVGSANLNNRSMLYDGETNVAVLDELWVSAERQRLFENLVGPDRAYLVSDDADANFELFRQVAEDNQAIREDWEVWIDDLAFDDLVDLEDVYRPDGFLYPLTIDPDYWWDVGPDLF